MCQSPPFFPWSWDVQGNESVWECFSSYLPSCLFLDVNSGGKNTLRQIKDMPNALICLPLRDEISISPLWFWVGFCACSDKQNTVEVMLSTFLDPDLKRLAVSTFTYLSHIRSFNYPKGETIQQGPETAWRKRGTQLRLSRDQICK